MSFGKVAQAIAERFRRTGQFVLKDLIAATACVSGDLIQPLKLVALLEFLHIIARIPASEVSSSSSVIEDGVVYIMPCVLYNASKDEIEVFYKETSHHHSIAPLMVRYKCGFAPIGIFSAMIASLVANSSFLLVEKGMMKDMIQFLYGSLCTIVTFISRPKFYGIVISKLPIVPHEPHSVCTGIRKEMESTFKKVSSRMNYGYFMDYQFAFECPSHPGREHLCVVDGYDTTPEVMLCLQDLTDKKPERLSCSHKVWFNEVSSISQVI